MLKCLAIWPRVLLTNIFLLKLDPSSCKITLKIKYHLAFLNSLPSVFIKDFFEESELERKEKMRSQIQAWKEGETKSFDSMWDDIKKDMLTKQEN